MKTKKDKKPELPATPPKLKMRKPSKHIVHQPAVIPARHEYTQPETLALGRELNGHLQRKRSLEAEKKSVVADYSAQIKRSDQDVEAVGQKISNGFELRDTQCTVEFDYKARKKLYFRNDTGEFVKESLLSEQDMQTTFPFSVPAKPESTAPVPALGHADGIVSVGSVMTSAERDAAKQKADAKTRKELLEPSTSED